MTGLNEDCAQPLIVIRVNRAPSEDIDDDTQALHPITGSLHGNRRVTDQLES
ncbi:hypothetical protein [uncultured Actinomyces sp.]|uniref:hypothetical protein n=1 Tax=uncultured Actinomyces sp. TaxID=249061 RepID=UPI0026741BBF|nr:hypothetical protein [uncultured Actinomyces sp.]